MVHVASNIWLSSGILQSFLFNKAITKKIFQDTTRLGHLMTSLGDATALCAFIRPSLILLMTSMPDMVAIFNQDPPQKKTEWCWWWRLSPKMKPPANLRLIQTWFLMISSVYTSLDVKIQPSTVVMLGFGHGAGSLDMELDPWLQVQGRIQVFGGRSRCTFWSVSCWRFVEKNPANSQVEVGSWSKSHYLQGFMIIPGGCLGFLLSTVVHHKYTWN